MGVVLNLAVWFGVHALWPGGGRLDWFAVIVCVVTLIGLVRWKWDVMAVVALCGIAGVLFQSFG